MLLRKILQNKRAQKPVMRRSARFWSDILQRLEILKSLYGRLRSPSAPRRNHRRSAIRFETLEQRAMLDGDPVLLGYDVHAYDTGYTVSGYNVNAYEAGHDESGFNVTSK